VSRKQIVILGGGTGGTMTANRLRRRFESDEAEIHVVDRDDRHVYQTWSRREQSSSRRRARSRWPSTSSGSSTSHASLPGRRPYHTS
jgi:NADH dehydrogenase FAD-containing subunit